MQRLLERAGADFILHLTEAPRHAEAIAAQARDAGAWRILVVGGDGTIHEVVSGLLSGKGFGAGTPPLPAIAVFPVGTGNDFHRLIRAPKGPEAAVRALLGGTERAFDVGHARWQGGEGHFVNLVGVGIDVEVLRNRPRFAKLPGLLQYLAAFVPALAGFRPLSLQVTFEGQGTPGETIEAPVLISAVTVGHSIGGGFLVSPDARPDDGLLDLFLVEKLGLGKVIRYLPGILRGSLNGKPEVHQAQVTRVEIRPMDGRPLSFELDGELMADETPSLAIQVLPRCLPILEPAGEAA